MGYLNKTELFEPPCRSFYEDGWINQLVHYFPISTNRIITCSAFQKITPSLFSVGSSLASQLSAGSGATQNQTHWHVHLAKWQQFVYRFAKLRLVLVECSSSTGPLYQSFVAKKTRGSIQDIDRCREGRQTDNGLLCCRSMLHVKSHHFLFLERLAR